MGPINTSLLKISILKSISPIAGMEAFTEVHTEVTLGE